MKINLKGLNLDEIESLVTEIGEPKFRASQIYNGIYKNRFSSLDKFSNLSSNLKENLNQDYEIKSLTLKKRLKSIDGTEKFTFITEDEKEIESVWIPSGDLERKTICISSQVGCTLSCAFCATGTLLDFKGNLKSWQIIDQIIQVEKLVGENCTNIVFMGMGEPMHNYKNVIKSAQIFHDEKAFNLGAKRITISTAGVVSGIDRFVSENQPFNFAISLNHPNPDKRSSIMNINNKYPLKDLLKSARNFTKTLKRKITFEYIMIPEINMGEENARLLVKLARSVNCKINLIPLNTTLNGWRSPTEKEIDEFKELIKPSNVPIMNRRSPGKDIHGACGMLALQGS
ncbi:MAG: 23S rRNA (adenine(2503)-C(2))-methyltransferase RlmN [Leptospiraceae bacterium]|nr:23S rRNA (adenine(2503)-C(2))-methyltransferase RlmN [Leptospiraceae bacterium]